MKIEIELTDDDMDRLFLDELKRQYSLVANDRSKNMVDRKYNKRLKKALKRVIRYNMTPDEYAEWANEE